MKVKCQKCGKKFDYNVYSGLCPKCRTYYRTRQKESYEEQQQAKQLEAKQQQAKQRQAKLTRERSRLYHIVTVTLLLAILLAAGIFVGGSFYTNWKGYNRLSLAKLPTPEPLVIGAVLPYETETVSYALTITGIETETGAFMKTPEGCESIRVSYEIVEESKEPEEEGKNMGGADQAEETVQTANYLSEYFRIIPYLQTKEGKYVQPVASYLLQQNLGYEYSQMEQEGIGDRFEYKKGSIYFTVKENDAQALLINTYKYESEYTSDDVLEQSYEITDLEVGE